jgi:hypothetical protein
VSPPRPLTSSSTSCNTTCLSRSGAVDGGREFACPVQTLAAARPASVRPAAKLSKLKGAVERANHNPHRGVLPSHCLLAGDETAQSRVAPVGKDLQCRLRTSSSWLRPPLQFPSALISTKGMKLSAIFRASAESSALGTFSVHSIRVRAWEYL